MNLLIKIIPNFKYHISTEFEINSRCYRGEEIILARTGQGNKFSGDIYRDISCLIIRQIEKENLRIQFKLMISTLQEQSMSVPFIDDTNLVIDEKEVEAKMQQ